MRQKELNSRLDEEIVEKINELSEKSYFDILIEDIYISDEIRSGRNYHKIKTFIEVSSIETWIENLIN